MFKFTLAFLLVALNLWAKTPNDTLIIAQENEPKRLNPAYSEDHDGAIALIFSGLTRFDENGNLKGDLAKSWKVSQDLLVYEFDLRDDVLWHDGVKFSAKDVKFSIEAFKNPKNNSSLRVNFENVKSVEVLSEFKVKITLSKPYPPFLDALSEGVLPSHLLENTDLNTAKFNQNPIGTGAYKFVEWKKGSYLRLVANENFYLTKVKTKNLILKHINDSSLSVLELKNGKIDVALVNPALVESFQKDKRFKILKEPSTDYRALMFNLNHQFLQDKSVRLALNYAVNKDIIVQKLLHGYGSYATHPLERSWANPNEFLKFEYSPKKAIQILENAGFKKNEKGIFEKNGKELEFEIYAMSNDALRVALAGILQSEFEKIGVKTKVIAKVSGSFDYTQIDSFVVGWGSPFDPDFHTFRVFESSQDQGFGGWNFGHYKDKSVDIALQKARTSQNKEQRKQAYENFISALHENPPYVFLVYLDFALIYAENITGIKPRMLGHHGVGFTWNAYEWSKN